MEIIKQGDLSKLKNPKRFECLRCGCEFLANDNEYVYEGMWRNLQTYTSYCPCCGTKTFIEE